MAAQPQFPAPVINVVPANYRWSEAAATAASEKGVFLRVGGTATNVGRRTLSGAKRAWASADPAENRTIFLVNHRVTGTPEAVQQTLAYAGFSEADIRAAIADAITAANYQTSKAAAFNDELARHQAARRDKPQAEGYSWDQIYWFSQNIASAQIGTKAGETRGGVAAGGRAGAGDSLAEKLRKLGVGKVLDVSNMDLVSGKGVRSIPAPKTAKSGKYGTLDIPIISNRIEQYERALELAYGADARAKYAAQIGQVRQALSGVPVARAPSPPRAAGATLAPAPAFVPAVRTPGRVATVGGAGVVPMPTYRQ